MKNNMLTSMLTFLLCLSALASCYYTYRYCSASSQYQAMRPKMDEVGKVMNIMQQILLDTQEYNHVAKNPDMTRLLQSITAPPAKPAGKPPTK